MKRFTLLVILILTATSLHAQTFSECAQNYGNRYKKMELDLVARRITQAQWDSTRNVIDADFGGCIIGKELGDYEVVTRTGETVTPEKLKGKVVLFNYWSLNCGPCIAEIPWLNKLDEKYRDNDEFVFVSFLFDKEADIDKMLARGLTRRTIDYAVVPNSKFVLKEQAKAFNVFPTSIFLDREGKIYRRITGAVVNDIGLAEIEQIINSELEKSGK